MINGAVIDAEIMWVLDVVMSNYSQLFSRKDLFKEIFKDSKIAQSFTWVLQNAHT